MCTPNAPVAARQIHLHVKNPSRVVGVHDKNNTPCTPPVQTRYLLLFCMLLHMGNKIYTNPVKYTLLMTMYMTMTDTTYTASNGLTLESLAYDFQDFLEGLL